MAEKQTRNSYFELATGSRIELAQPARSAAAYPKLRKKAITLSGSSMAAVNRRPLQRRSPGVMERPTRCRPGRCGGR